MGRRNLTIFRFFNDADTLKSEQRLKGNIFIPNDTADNVKLFSVDVEEYPEICQAANVNAPVLVVFKNGQEVIRYPGGNVEQIEYVVSRILCGLMGPKGELSAES